VAGPKEVYQPPGCYSIGKPLGCLPDERFLSAHSLNDAPELA
jgi:hypothetical protein